MTINEDEVDFAALADGTLSGPEWDAWLVAHPREAAEIAIARRVRALIAQLRSADIAVPIDFEVRVLARVRANTTLLDLFELSLAGVGRALLGVLDIFFAVLPAPRSAAE